jgi:hypothetical protein
MGKKVLRNILTGGNYGKRVFFLRFFTADEIDFLFKLSKKHPAVADEINAGVYDYTHVIADYFMGLPEIPDQLKEKMKMIKEADMDTLLSVVSKRED